MIGGMRLTLNSHPWRKWINFSAKIDIGTTTGGMGNLFGNVGALASDIKYVLQSGSSTYATSWRNCFYDINSYYPNMLKAFQNRLFCADFHQLRLRFGFQYQ